MTDHKYYEGELTSENLANEYNRLHEFIVNGEVNSAIKNSQLDITAKLYVQASNLPEDNTKYTFNDLYYAVKNVPLNYRNLISFDSIDKHNFVIVFKYRYHTYKNDC